VTIRTAQRNPSGETAEQIVATARALRTQYLVSLIQAAGRRIAAAVAAVRAAQARREALQAINTLDRHTLVDVGLDRFVGNVGVPANENRPRNVA
jgi:uncharacterized protein YjiS (DUF1127 family)